MYLIPMNRRIVWQWFHVRTLKFAEVMLRNRKTRDCIMQKYFRFDASSCTTRSVLGIFISCIYSVHLKRISCRIEWFLFQLHSPKHARVIIILLMIRKAIILAFRSQAVKLWAGPITADHCEHIPAISHHLIRY